MKSIEEQIEELYMLTNTSKRSELSKTLDISPSTVTNWKHRNKIPEYIFLRAKQISMDKEITLGEGWEGWDLPKREHKSETRYGTDNIEEQLEELKLLTKTNSNLELSKALDVSFSDVEKWVCQKVIPEYAFLKAKQIYENIEIDSDADETPRYRCGIPVTPEEVHSKNTGALLDKVKILTGTKTDLQLAVALGVTISDVVKWKCTNKIPVYILKQFDLFTEDDNSEDLVSNTTPTNSLKLPFYDVEVSAGHGTLVPCEERSEDMVFSQRFVTDTLGVKANNIFLMPVRGDSMVPTLKNQSLIIVNRTDQLIEDGVYVFRYDGQLRVKRLQFSKIGITVVSDNPAYKTWELSKAELATEDFEIIGEVIWSGQKM